MEYCEGNYQNFLSFKINKKYQNLFKFFILFRGGPSIPHKKKEIKKRKFPRKISIKLVFVNRISLELHP